MANWFGLQHVYLRPKSLLLFNVSHRLLSSWLVHVREKLVPHWLVVFTLGLMPSRKHNVSFGQLSDGCIAVCPQHAETRVAVVDIRHKSARQLTIIARYGPFRKRAVHKVIDHDGI